MAERHPRKLTVTSCVEFRRGHGAKGEWIIYEVKADDENGEPVKAKLRAFKSLPIGVEQVYEVEKHVHETYGESFTLYPPKQKTNERVDDLERRVGELEQKLAGVIAQLESRDSADANAGSSSHIQY